MSSVGAPSNLALMGEFIRAQRKMMELSQRELAKLTKLSDPYVSQLERGLHAPSVRVLKALAEALNVRAETLLQFAGLYEDSSEYLRLKSPSLLIWCSPISRRWRSSVCIEGSSTHRRPPDVRRLRHPSASRPVCPVCSVGPATHWGQDCWARPVGSNTKCTGPCFGTALAIASCGHRR